MELMQSAHHSKISGWTAETMIDRWESRREIKNLMGKYANCLILNRDAEICTLFWSRERDDICLGLNKGWYAGQSAVRGYYQARHERSVLVVSLLKKRFPDRLGDKDEKELFGIGSFTVKPMACPLIEIAGDGETAQGIWYSQGAYAETGERGPSASWTWGYCAADFVMEEGEWRIWHLLCVDDVDCRCGTSWGKSSGAAVPPELHQLPEFAPLRDFEMPQPNIPGILRQYYTPDRPLTPPPKLPEAYETFSDTFSYGPVQEPAVKPAEPKHPPSGDNPVSSEDITLICRVWDVEDIKTLVSKRVYYIAGDMRREELDELWVHDAEAQKSSSFGRNWGWYTGMEEIRRYYVDAHEAFLRTQMRENHAAAENIGNLYAHPATTGLVELAGDGKTARGLWYAIAQETISRPDGTAEARWMLEKIAIDFLKEEDGWKIWHLMIAADLSCLAGEDYSKQPVYPDPETNPIRLEFGKPSVEALIHDSTFNWWDDYPPIPKPYESFSGSMGYGPEGYRNPAIKGFGAGEGRNYH